MRVAAIAGLFAIRKFLLRREDKPERSSKKKELPAKESNSLPEEERTVMNTDFVERA